MGYKTCKFKLYDNKHRDFDVESVQTVVVKRDPRRGFVAVHHGKV